MFILYSFLYTLGFAALTPLFIARRAKYSAGFRERFGYLPDFEKDHRPVIWIHCVSVGETNAAKPLVELLREEYGDFRIVISNVTKTGHELAARIFDRSSDLVFYFPFDWRFTVRRTLRALRPSIVMLMETEIWFNFAREARKRGIPVVIVNGRLSERSFAGYKRIGKMMKRVFRYFHSALVQSPADARRFERLGMKKRKIKVTGNIKFDQLPAADTGPLVAYFRERFGAQAGTPLILAASTHAPEERLLLEALRLLRADSTLSGTRLMIAPRHPERFEEVARLIGSGGFHLERRTGVLEVEEHPSDVILLDSVGELRSVYPLADVVFVGGSLIPHGGQNLLEPALEKKAIVTGAHLQNFEAVAEEFASNQAFVKLPDVDLSQIPTRLASEFNKLLTDGASREELGRRAFKTVARNKGASRRTLEHMAPILRVHVQAAGK